jgi:flavin reductase (DIM6/NTAB) family NADH-FMN oxidoreductase RutF
VNATNITAVPFDAGIDEISAAGLTTRKGTRVPCPSIVEAPAAFECRHHVTLSIGNSREIILGEVVHAHFHPSIVNARFHVDPITLDAIGRMGGHGYATTRDYFDLKTMNVEEWESGTVPKPEER